MSEFIKTGVIGHPVSHTRSPLIHNYWIEKYGLKGSYEAMDIKPENLGRKLKCLIGEGYKGFSVTLPHKELVAKLCDDIDDIARKVGAVNTVYIENGRLCATNTDVFGFTENIRQSQPGFDFKAGPAVVLGAGGASRAVIYALVEEGVPEIYLLNRSRGKSDAISTLYSRIKPLPWDQRDKIIAHANILVNTTALGMSGKPELEIDLSALPQTALVNDIVYAPLITPLLQNAHARGNKVVTGIGMLLQQARPAFNKWYGVMPDSDAALERKVLA
jgi:shikimate dehydrogenase